MLGLRCFLLPTQGDEGEPPSARTEPVTRGASSAAGRGKMHKKWALGDF